MRKKGKYFAGLLFLCLLFGIQASAAEKQTIHNSPYVTYSPDGKAWTTNAGETDYVWYDKGTMVSTGISSTLRQLQTGEHYYKAEREGEIPIGFWKVRHRPAQCIHDSYPEEDYYHGIQYGKSKCGQYYYSGWTPYCADCGEMLFDMYFYMSREAAASIDYLDIGNEMQGGRKSYYYLCPHCTNLEQGAKIEAHKCKAISWNQYKVKYDENCQGMYGGYMADSVHMYNNASEYEGLPVTPVTHLTKNAYTRTGYAFAGWNTKPDGSGEPFTDEAEIYNLTAVDWNNADTWTAKDEGVITLYAQWRPSSGTLVIDANGGTYQGQEKLRVDRPYLSVYPVENGKLTAPEGYTVSFEANGGTAAGPIRGTNRFAEWSINPDYRGDWYRNVYTFLAPDGHTDTLTALYEPVAVLLPGTTRPGYSFGGWYYDPSFEQPAGGPGDSLIPSKDLTLYAQWVDLRLTAEDNYRANGGKGAVDLSWSQADGKSKAYKLYQSRDGRHFLEIHSASDVGNTASVRESFPYSGREGRYKVPYTGLYTLTASGAAGGDHGGNRGGYGGTVTGSFWLSEGEMLTFSVGGKNGYNGGGAASAYGNGGGMTQVVSDRKGTLLIAGGGGGASPAGNGGAGGSALSVISGNAGAAGMAGGGAGYQGGAPGEHILHRHEASCLVDTSYAPASWLYWAGVNGHSASSSQTGGMGHTKDGDPHMQLVMGAKDVGMTEGTGIPTNGNETVSFRIHTHSWGPGTAGTDMERSYVQILDQNRKVIAGKSFAKYPFSSSGSSGDSWEDQDGWHGTPDVRDLYTLVSERIPAGTTAVYIRILTYFKAQDAWFSSNVEDLTLSGTRTVCGYEEGQILSSKPAYGGSNYVNPGYSFSYQSEAGKQDGNGGFLLQSDAVGFLEGLSLPDVTATDFAAPDPVDLKGVAFRPDEGEESGILVEWQEPADGGTDYFHYAESYLPGASGVLCTSNLTKNTLTSGIEGYYAVLDNAPGTSVTAKNGHFQSGRQYRTVLQEESNYLHVAAVDRAGNLSSTAHIPVGTAEETEIAWKLYTRPLRIEEGENVSAADTENTWYVRSDGRTPFLLQLAGYMDGPAREDYQINETIYESVVSGETARNVIRTENGPLSEETIRTEGEALRYAAEGVPKLTFYPYSYTERSGKNRELLSVQKFTIGEKDSGSTIRVTPVVGAACGKTMVYSEQELDARNGITLIADGNAPVIRGLETLEDKELINRTDGAVRLTVTAADDLSGVREWYVKVVNTDNTIEKVYRPDESGIILMDITKDEPVFSGDFTVTGYAADRVGNEREVSYGTTEFSLTASVERILSPHDPVFQCGESGILTIITYGYADRVEVEFPEEMAALDPELNRVFDYSDKPEYVREERLQFMIPLGMQGNGSYTITVRAYKGEKHLEDAPSLSTVEVKGSILGELRTRLR